MPALTHQIARWSQQIVAPKIGGYARRIQKAHFLIDAQLRTKGNALMTIHSLLQKITAFIGAIIISIFALAALIVPAYALGHKHEGGYILTITNTMSDELLAPILVTRAKNDRAIFEHDYVTPEAEEQILTGDPGKLVEKIGKNAIVGHGSDGPPGVLLAPGKSIEIAVSGQGPVRLIAMVAPTMFNDHFVTAVVNPRAELPVMLDRYDIGHDEGTKSTSFVSSAAATVSVRIDKGDEDMMDDGKMKDDMMDDGEMKDDMMDGDKMDDDKMKNDS